MKKSLLPFVFISLLIGSLMLPAVYAGESSSRPVALDFLKEVPSWMAELNVPAVGIGVIENGKIEHIEVFGELRQGVPAPKDSVFNVASITKTFTATLALRLVETGQWSLDDPLAKYWVDPDVESDPHHKKLTTRHVLTHTTGFVNWRRNHATGKLTFDHPPGAHYGYSGEGFEYLARAMERKFNKSLEQLVGDLLFGPVGIEDTHYVWDETKHRDRFAVWHDSDGNEHMRVDEDGKKYELNYRIQGSASDDLLTTVEDYCKFGIYVMKGAGISKPLFQEMVTPQTNIKKLSAQGLGWMILTGLPADEYAIYHGGSDYGVKTMCVFLPKSQRGVVVFTNGDNGMAIYNNVIKEVFDIGDVVYTHLYERSALPNVVSLPDARLEKLVGRYQPPGGRVFNIAKKGGHLQISGAGIPPLNLYPQNEKRFFCREYEVYVTFEQNDSGSIEKMVIYQDGEVYAETKRLK